VTRALPRIDDEEFSAFFEQLELRLAGDAEKSVANRLDRLVKQVHELIVGSTAKQVHVDWTALEFMSAACLNVFASWVIAVAALGADRSYQLRFVINPTLAWQKRSVDALLQLAPTIVVAVAVQ
jgi:hypothetical protein